MSFSGQRNSWQRLFVLMVCASIVGCSWLRAAVKRDESEAERLSQAARRAEQGGNLDEAASLLAKATEANPDDVEIRRRLIEVLLTQGKKADAAEHLRESVAKSPDDARSGVRLARLLCELKEFDEAEERIGAALAVDPKSAEALLLKSELAERKHNDKVALETAYRVLAIDENNVDAQLRIAAIHLRSSQPDRAAPLLRSVCQNTRATAEQLSQARWSLGLSYGQQQRWDEAADAIAAALESRPNASADDWYRLAYAHYFTGDLDAAGRDLVAALKLQPNHPASRALASTLNVGLAQSPIASAGYSQPTIARPTGW